MALSKDDREEIADLIKATVNGKIDRLSSKLDENSSDIKMFYGEIQPFIKAASGLKILYKLLIGLAALVVALDQILDFGIIRGIISQFK